MVPKPAPPIRARSRGPNEKSSPKMSWGMPEAGRGLVKGVVVTRVKARTSTLVLVLVLVLARVPSSSLLVVLMPILSKLLLLLVVVTSEASLRLLWPSFLPPCDDGSLLSSS